MLAPKMRLGGVPHRLLGVIFEVFEVLGGLGLPSASWEVFWAALGRVLAHLGRLLTPRRLLAASRAALGRILKPSWAVFGRTTGKHGSDLGPTMEPKFAKNRSMFHGFRVRFLMPLFSNFGAKLSQRDPN